MVAFTFLRHVGEGIGGYWGLALVALLVAGVGGLIRLDRAGPHAGIIWCALCLTVGLAIAKSLGVLDLVFWPSVLASSVITSISLILGLLFYKRFLERYGGPVFPET